MSYNVHNFETGGTINASDFNEMDAQIKELTDSGNATSGVTYESYTLTEDKQFIEADLNGYEELSIMMKIPSGGTMTYGYLCRDGGIKSGFSTVNWRNTDTVINIFVSIKKIGDSLWFFTWKKGNGNTYETTTFIADNGFSECFLTVDPTSFGVCAYGSDVFPVGTEVNICRGRAI